MTRLRCPERSESSMVRAPEEPRRIKAVHLGDGIKRISRFPDQRNNLNVTRSSSPRSLCPRQNMRRTLHSTIALLWHRTIDVILAAMSACAIVDKGINRYLSARQHVHNLLCVVERAVRTVSLSKRWACSRVSGMRVALDLPHDPQSLCHWVALQHLTGWFGLSPSATRVKSLRTPQLTRQMTYGLERWLPLKRSSVAASCLSLEVPPQIRLSQRGNQVVTQHLPEHENLCRRARVVSFEMRTCREIPRMQAILVRSPHREGDCSHSPNAWSRRSHVCRMMKSLPQTHQRMRLIADPARHD